MKKYDVKYQMRNPRYPKQIAWVYGWAEERIEARGIVHASKKARDHMRELQKIAPKKLAIEWIREVRARGEP